MEDRSDESLACQFETQNEALISIASSAAAHAGHSDSKLPWLVKMVAPRSLRPARRNARTHSKKQIRLIKESIKRYRLINPIVVDTTGVVIAGHARLRAALELELALVPVIQVDHLSETEQRAYALADNALSDKSGWDRTLLAVELSELVELMPHDNMDITLTGFEVAELDLLFADMTSPPQPGPDGTMLDVPQHPVTRRGDIWQLGRHRLLCADARDPGNFTLLTGGAKVAAAILDPPFNVKVSSIVGRGQTKHAEFAFASGEMSPEEYRAFLATTLGNGLTVSASGALHYVFIDWRHVDTLIGVGRELFDAMLNLLVWDKVTPGQGSFYRSQYELIGLFRAAGGPHRNNIQLGQFGRNRSNVWSRPGMNSFGQGRMDALQSHPTVKPVGLIAEAILDCTAPGEFVLDQFAGSGTIFLAAEKVGRTALGMEYEPGYVEVAIRRWQAVTKLEATLDGDGRTFGEIAAARGVGGANE
jgi:DNA modification methylase